MLMQIRAFIEREKRVSHQQVARALQIDDDAIQPMLDIWLKKGVIERIDTQSSCRGGCTGCHTSSVQYRYCSSQQKNK